MEPSLWSLNWSRWGNIHCRAVGGNKEDSDQQPQVVMSVTSSAGRTSLSAAYVTSRHAGKMETQGNYFTKTTKRQINWNDHRDCNWIKLQWLSWGSIQTCCAIQVCCQLSFHSRTKPHIPLLCTATVMESCSNSEISKFFLEVYLITCNLSCNCLRALVLLSMA